MRTVMEFSNRAMALVLACGMASACQAPSGDGQGAPAGDSGNGTGQAGTPTQAGAADALVVRAEAGPGGFEARVQPASVQLEDGGVLIIGGYQYEGSGVKLMSSVERYDPFRREFVEASPLSTLAGAIGAATLLHDGRVLVTGGSTSAEIYDPKTGQFWAIGPMSRGRTGHQGTLLDDGRVLLSGSRVGVCKGFGEMLASTEYFDPAGETFAAGPAMRRGRANHNAIKLNDGRVLVTGGINCYHSGVFGWYEESIDSAEIYDPETDSFREITGMSSARSGHRSFLLEDGRVLVIGGEARRSGVRQIEIFDPETETFRAFGYVPTGSVEGVVALADGRIFFHGEREAYVFDATDGSIEELGVLAQTRRKTQVYETDEGVLVIGGAEEASTERFVLNR